MLYKTILPSKDKKIKNDVVILCGKVSTNVFISQVRKLKYIEDVT